MEKKEQETATSETTDASSVLDDEADPADLKVTDALLLSGKAAGVRARVRWGAESQCIAAIGRAESLLQRPV